MANRLRNKLALAAEQVKEAYENGATLKDIAEVHEVSQGTVRNKLIELGVDLRPRGRPKRDGGTDERVLPVETLNTSDEAACTVPSDPTPGLI